VVVAASQYGAANMPVRRPITTKVSGDPTDTPNKRERRTAELSTVPAAAPRAVESDQDALILGEEFDPLAPFRGMAVAAVAGTSLWLLILAALMKLLR
jgi:hypothetical protein